MRIVIANLSSALTSLLSSSWVYKPQEWIFSGVLELIFELMHVKMIIIAGLSCISSFASRSTWFENDSKCLIRILAILAFSTNFLPIEIDLSGNTI